MQFQIHHSCFHPCSNDGETGYMSVTAKLSPYPSSVLLLIRRALESHCASCALWTGWELMITWGKFFLAKTMIQRKDTFTCNLKMRQCNEIWDIYRQMCDLGSQCQMQWGIIYIWQIMAWCSCSARCSSSSLCFWWIF